MSDSEQDLDFLSGLSFSPDWAKQSADSQMSKLQRYTSHDDHGGDSRHHRGPRHDRRREDRDDSRSDNRRPKRFTNRDDKPRNFGDRREQPRDGQTRSAPRQSEVRSQTRERPQRSHQPRPERAPLPFDIRFLPDQKALSIIAKKVHAGHRAIPLRDLVKLFFDNPDSTEVRLEFKNEHKDQRFWQCSKCGWFAMTEDEVRSHIMTEHFPEYFDSEEIAVNPPTGNFTSVAKCGFSGKLLAPPNHHSYNKKIQAMLRTEFVGKTEEEYRAHIELINTPEAIEQWKQESSTKMVYKLREPEEKKVKGKKKGGNKPVSESVDATVATTEGETPVEEVVAPVVPQLSFEEAEAKFCQNIMPKLLKSERQVTATHAVSKTIGDRTITNAISRAWDREQVIQTASLFFAVRGGLRSQKLALFRAGDTRRVEFVMHKVPTVLDTTHAVPELKLITEYITEHPGCTRATLIADLIHSEVSAEQAENILKQILFVTERAYVIEYFNGVLALAAEHPFYMDIKHEEVPADAPAAEAESVSEAAVESAVTEESVIVEEPAKETVAECADEICEAAPVEVTPEDEEVN